MDIKVEVRIKLDDGKEIKMSHADARKLYGELKVLFDKDKEHHKEYTLYPNIPYDASPVWRDRFIYTDDKTIPNFSPIVITCNAESIPNKITLSAVDEARGIVKDFNESKCLKSLRVKPENDIFEKAMIGAYE